MAEIVTAQMEMGPGTLTIGESSSLKSFAQQVTSSKLSPDISYEKDQRVLSGGVVAGDRTESYTLEIEFFQDIGATDSFVEFCYTNAGKQMPFTWAPNNATKKAFKGHLLIDPVEVGGDSGTKPTTSAKFKVIGIPTLSAFSEEG